MLDFERIEMANWPPYDDINDRRFQNDAPTPDETIPSLAKPRITISKEDVRSVPKEALRKPSRRVQVSPIEKQRMSGKAITALVFGILGIPLMGILLGPFAIIFGGWSLYEIKRAHHLTGRSIALTGISLGVFGILLWTFVFILLLVLHMRVPFIP